METATGDLTMDGVVREVGGGETNEVKMGQRANYL